MTDAALRSAGTYSQVRVREPLGDRVLGEILTIGGEGADIVVPGVDRGPAAQVVRRKGIWIVSATSGATVRVDGQLLDGPRDLSRHDVLAIGNAQIIVTAVTRTLLRIEVCHLAGNATIAPAGAISPLTQSDDEEELLIRAPVPVTETQVAASAVSAAPLWQVALARVTAAIRGLGFPRTRGFRTGAAILAACVLAFVGFASQLNSVPLEVEPADALVRVPGSWVAIHVAGDLLLLPGAHVVSAEHKGYVPAQVNVIVARGTRTTARLRLAKLPGTLGIDTAQVPATVLVDGVESGDAPGVITMAPGTHTLMFRAPRYVDYIASVAIEGAGVRQELKVALQPSWGTLQISAIPAGARVAVDGVDSGVTPVVVDAPSGVRQIRISAPDLKTWESSVVLKAGEALNVGPITLGKPDARLTLRSIPSGAEVAVGGIHRGFTPLELDLPAGIEHELMVSSGGYATWTQAVFADAGKKINLAARLEAVGGKVTVQGVPDGAELIVDGADRGRTPQSLELSATEHHIEVRKQGWATYRTTLTPAKGLDRTLQYRLVSEDRSLTLAQVIYSQTGYPLRLIPAGSFSMGSERREQGRRPNEGYRLVTLKRPLYFGVAPVTNEQFRRFRADHTSGFIDRHSIDLDDQPVTRVTWNDAVEYCNWLSERDSLPGAYEKREDTYVLKRPVTIGYRLPTEAEWEYAARYAAPGQFRRYAWGDALPMPSDVGNLAGAETGNSLPAVLQGYRDDYPVVAPVGRFKPTPLGLHDMSGNVSVWIDDYYLSFVDPAPVTDPLGPADGTRHVIRGANWRSASVTDLRLAWRDGSEADSTTIGFRVVRYAE